MEFTARILGPSGIETVHLTAESPAAARAELAARQTPVLRLEARSTASAGRRAPADFDLLLFSQELLALLEAGLGLAEALAALHEKERRPGCRELLGAVREQLAEGQRFAAALASRPDAFPRLYCGLMRAAEGTASLDQSLARYIEYRQRVDQVRRHVSQALIYPAILLGVGALVSAFLLGYVVPRFSTVYQNAGRDIPLASQWLMAWGQLASQHGRTLGLGLAVLVGSATFGLARPASRARLRAAVLAGCRRLPHLGERLRTFELARLYLALGTLLGGGLPILEALGLTRGVVDTATGERLQAAAQHIADGLPASTAFETAGLTTPVALRLMQVGERTGQLGEMLTRAARFHDGESERFISRFTRSFEPLLMAAIGLLVGTIVVLLYLPIFDLAGSFQ